MEDVVGNPQSAEVSHLLNPLGWPQGLQKTILKTCLDNPLRFFIIDDSGSMCCNDGHKMVGQGASTKLVEASRWNELGDSIRFHAQFAHAAGAPTQFRFLNATEPLVIGVRDFSGQSDINLGRLLRILEGGPNGGTPLCEHIRAVTAEITAAAPTLKQNGQKAVIVIATDGEASDGDILSAMRPLKSLPVHVIIRMCTDDERICTYWNNIDKELELQMDILDDFEGEAKEIFEHNPWIVYGEPIHRLREWGITIKDFDMLDEAKLSSEQMRAIVAYTLVGGNPRELPQPDSDWKMFEKTIEAINVKEQKLWNPLTRKLEHVINMRSLKKIYASGGGGGCTVM